VIVLVFLFPQTWADLNANSVALFKCLEKVSTDPADNRSSYRSLLAGIGRARRPLDYSLGMLKGGNPV
jgi:hypothetical protein